jgi:hypothetical protein
MFRARRMFSYTMFRARRMFSCLTQHTPCLKVDFTIFTHVPANPAWGHEINVFVKQSISLFLSD